LPELVYGHVETMLEVTGGGSRPKAVPKIFTDHEIARPFNQRL
jgi:hypothetical protein